MAEPPTRRLTLTTCDDAATVPSRWRLCAIAPLRTKPAPSRNGLIPPLSSRSYDRGILMSSSNRLIGLLNNSRFIFIVAMAAGLALSGAATQTERVLVPGVVQHHAGCSVPRLLSNLGQGEASRVRRRDVAHAKTMGAVAARVFPRQLYDALDHARYRAPG